VTTRPWYKNYDPGVPETIQYPEVPVFHFIEEAAAKIGGQACTVFRDSTLRYGEMNDLVDRLAAALAGLGVEKGDRVGVLLPNIPQFVLAYFAILKAGGVVVAINPQYKQRELDYQLADAGVKIIIGLENAYPLLQSAREHTRLKTIILSRVEDALDMPSWAAGGKQKEDYPDLTDPDRWLGAVVTSQPPGSHSPVKVSSDDVAIFQYSGGTTGVPKGAVGLHRNLVANSLMFRRWLVGLEEGKETTLMAIPMYHVYGMVVGLSVSILLGAKMVLIPDPRDLNALLHSIDMHQASFFPGVPTMYALINQYPDVQAGKYNLRSICACISGSAPLLREVRERFEQLTGAKLMEGYGLSEAPTATHCNPMFGEKRSGSIGLPLPDVDCQVVHLEDGETIMPAGEIGELLIRSPQIMKNYHNQPQETETALRGGWLHTGDIARMDEDGYFYIVGRKKELIKVSGFQVWPLEIEEVIAAHSQVLEVSVAGIPDPIRGEAPKAWVVLRPGTAAVAGAPAVADAAAVAGEIRSWCEEALVYYKVPVEVEFRDALPRTPVGKVLRRELVRQHLQAQE